jgi:hypothetical protein
MHKVKINDYISYLPSSWDELTRDNVFTLVRFLNTSQTETSLKLKILIAFLKLKLYKKDPILDPEDKKTLLYFVYHKGSKPFLISSQQLTDLLPALDFLFETITEKDKEYKVISSRLTKNPVPDLKWHGNPWPGPSEKLFNITFEEYIFSETNYINYLKSRDDKDLDKLIATLYRPQDPKYSVTDPFHQGDSRLPFNSHTIDARAKDIEKYPKDPKMAIVLFYQGCKTFLASQFPHVFERASDSKPNPLGFLALVDALTDGDVTKTESVRKSLLYDIMVHLEQTAIKAIEMKEKLNTHK